MVSTLPNLMARCRNWTTRAAACLKAALAMLCWVAVSTHAAVTLSIIVVQAAMSHTLLLPYIHLLKKDVVLYQKMFVLPWVLTACVVVIGRICIMVYSLIKRILKYMCCVCRTSKNAKFSMTKQNDKVPKLPDLPPLGPSQLQGKPKVRQRRSYAVVHNFTKKK